MILIILMMTMMLMIAVIVIEYLLCARCSAKKWIQFILFNPPKNYVIDKEWKVTELANEQGGV